MQYLLGLTIALPVAAGTSRVSESDQVDLDSGVDQKWTIVEKNCWRFQVNGIRALDQGAQNFDPSWTTPAKCQAACESEGYALAAVEHGMNCWCGNTILGDASPVAEELCNEPCSGDEHQTCGGYGYMNLYARNDVGLVRDAGVMVDQSHMESGCEGWEALACYKDHNAYHRLLPFQPHDGQPERMRTVGGCITSCRSHGYHLAGLEYGKECWCGNQTPSEHLRGGKCDMPCTGNGKQICGGSQSLLVYRNDDAGMRSQATPGASYGPGDDAETPRLGRVKSLQEHVQESAAIPRRALPPLPKLPKLPGLPGLPGLPKPVPDVGNIIKVLKPMVGHMFQKITSDVALSKKAAQFVLDHVPKALAEGDLTEADLDTTGPASEVIEKIKSIVSKLFDRLAVDVQAGKKTALSFLDHLPGKLDAEDEGTDE